MRLIVLLVGLWAVLGVGRWLWLRVPIRGKRPLRDMAGYAILIAFSVLFVGPFVWMLSTSLKSDSQVLSAQTQWLPTVPTVKVHKQDENGSWQDVYEPTKEAPRLAPQWHNYPDALTSFPFVRYTLNTLVICVLTMIGTVFSAALPAYGFSRLKWKGRDALFFLLIATIMLPPQVTMLPVFLIFRALHWTGTLLPLVVPSFFGSAFYIFLLRQFFLTIPQELSDAARIDGCGELGILLRILAPIARPALATVALLSFTSAWMDFAGPLIYLHDERTYTLAIGLMAFLGRHGGEWSLLMAASMVMTAPMLVLFFFAQRTYIQGIALTGLKG